MIIFPVPARIDIRRFNTNPKVVVNGSVSISCPAAGVPTPNITWFKDGTQIDESVLQNVNIKDDGRELTISDAQVHMVRYPMLGD